MGFEELKKRQSAVWSSAPYEHVADTILNMYDHLVSRLAPRPGERWLDVATVRARSPCAPPAPGPR